MASNNRIVQYELDKLDNFNFNKRNVNKITKIAKNIDKFLNTNEYKDIVQQAIQEKNADKVGDIYRKANEINKKYMGSLTNKASFITMKKRLSKQIKHKNLNETKGRKTSGYRKSDDKEFYYLVGSVFKELQEENERKNRKYYYDSAQAVGLAHAIRENRTGDLESDIKNIVKEAKKLNLKVSDKEILIKLSKLADDYKNNSYYFEIPDEWDY